MNLSLQEIELLRDMIRAWRGDRHAHCRDIEEIVWFIGETLIEKDDLRVPLLDKIFAGADYYGRNDYAKAPMYVQQQED